MKLNLIVENKTYRDHIHAEHGLALLIETDEKTILFDSGESNALIKNAEIMELDLADVDLAVLSHGHADHSGGFPYFNKVNPNAKIYLHKNAFKDIYDIDKDGNPTEKKIGIRWTDSERRNIESKLAFTDEPIYITDNIVISGSIPSYMREMKTEQFPVKTNDGYILDNMDHEQFLIIKEDNDLFIFSGCSHNGVVPIIKYTKELFPDHDIKLLFGGFHLYHSPYDRLSFEIKRILDLDVEYYIPVHCTGLNAIIKMKELLGERCILLNAGDKLFL